MSFLPDLYSLVIQDHTYLPLTPRAFFYVGHNILLYTYILLLQVLTTSLVIEQVSYKEKDNLWIGPRQVRQTHIFQPIMVPINHN